jgi:hypothetical protein
LIFYKKYCKRTIIKEYTRPKIYLFSADLYFISEISEQPKTPRPKHHNELRAISSAWVCTLFLYKNLMTLSYQSSQEISFQFLFVTSHHHQSFFFLICKNLNLRSWWVIWSEISFWILEKWVEEIIAWNAFHFHFILFHNFTIYIQTNLLCFPFWLVSGEKKTSLLCRE